MNCWYLINTCQHLMDLADGGVKTQRNLSTNSLKVNTWNALAVWHVVVNVSNVSHVFHLELGRSGSLTKSFFAQQSLRNCCHGCFSTCSPALKNGSKHDVAKRILWNIKSCHVFELRASLLRCSHFGWHVCMLPLLWCHCLILVSNLGSADPRLNLNILWEALICQRGINQI